MNNREFECVRILTDLVENYGLVGIKTSFEDEGASFNEVLRLKEICNQSKTKVTLKIGGPEAIRDIKDSMIIGVKGLVAPMVESEFGLTKFINAVNNNLPVEVVSSLQLNVNIETITAVSNIDKILSNKQAEALYGVTLGRVDLVSSQITPNEWTHVVCQKSGSEYQIWLNGQLNVTQSYTITNSIQNDRHFLIGGDGLYSTFSGSLDEIKVFNKALCVALE